MQSTIQKWGNSSGIRIPKYILEAIQLSPNDLVDIELVDEKIIISKTKKSHLTVSERISMYYAKAPEQLPHIGRSDTEEWDTGAPAGEEEL